MTRLRTLLETSLGFPFVPGNRVEVLRNGDEIFPAMLTAIETATKTIDLVTYVYWTGNIAQLFANTLAERARSGVKVRVLLDAFGSQRIDDRLVDLMQLAGVEVRWFRPFSQWKIWKWNNRTHRKILVCDHQVAFTGGVGIAAQWEGNARNASEWRETHFRIDGPVVNAIRSGFLCNWSETVACVAAELQHSDTPAAIGPASIQVIRSPSSVNWSDIALLYQVLIVKAERKIFITTAYFVPDEILTSNLCAAVERGVAVKLLLPGEHTDQRLSQLGGEDRYAELLAAGVEIFRYDQTMLHAKLLLVDDSLAVVGSANMNHRSMSKDEEFCLVIEDDATIAKLNEHFTEDLSNSKALDMAQWRKRTAWQRLGELAARILRTEL